MQMDTFPSSEVFPTLINDDRNSSNVSASAVVVDSCGKGRRVTYLPLLVPTLATATSLCDGRKIGNSNMIRSASLMIQAQTITT